MTPASDSLPTPLRGLLFDGPDKPLRIEALARPSLEAGEALVQVEMCTLCGSDLHTYAGDRTEPTPLILGHEILGRIAEVGSLPPRSLDGQILKPGQRVTWSVCVSCGDCPRCQNGLPQKCLSVQKFGHTRAEGRAVLTGGLADAVWLPRGSAVLVVPEDLPAEVLCPVNCATATVAAAMRVAGDLRGQRVLIFGAGLLGLTATAWCHTRQASEIVVLDRSPARGALAQRFGADEVWERLPDHGERGTFDRVFELCGAPEAVEQAFAVAGVGAAIVLVGSVKTSPAVALDPERIVRQCWNIHGVHNYRPDDLQAALAFLVATSARYPWAELVTRRFPLDQAENAFRWAREHQPVRVAVTPLGDSVQP